MQQSISEIFRNANEDIMAEEEHDDGESVWTDYESESEEAEEDDDEEDEEDVFYAHHETLAEPCFELSKQFDPCAICFEDIKMVNMMVTRCGHVFHASCMFVAIATNHNCPLCRTELICSHSEEVVVSWTIDRTPTLV